MSRFLIACYAVLVCAGLIFAGAPTESHAQGVAAPPVVVGAPPPQCSLGFALVGQKCVFKQCPPNYKLADKKCEKIVIHIPKQCSEAEQWANKCNKNGQPKATDFVPGCPAGQHWAGKKGCIKN